MAAGQIYGREAIEIEIGKGVYTSELSSNIPNGFSAQAFNCIASGDSLENRQGFTPSSVDYRKFPTGYPQGFAHNFSQLSNGGDASLPVLGWNDEQGNMYFIRGGYSGSGDGFMGVNPGGGVIGGICAYGNIIYFSIPGTGVFKITAFNWVADSITYAAVAGSPAGPLFSFKDRLWTWGTNRLYFTELAAPGGQPENWNGAANYIVFSNYLGNCNIVQVVPIGNRLLVFTDAGLFTVTVQGAQASWIVRTLDIESTSRSAQCGFESKGIVYYTNSQGVWATNGIYVTKLSAVIEDQFFKAPGDIRTSLHALEDGMLLNIVKYGAGQIDTSGCRTFYSKLDPVGWTEWGIHSVHLYANPDNIYETYFPNNPYRLQQVHSISKKVSTFLSKDPTVYMLVTVGNSTGPINQDVCTQLCIYDGGVDKLHVPIGSSTSVLLEENVEIYLKTKFFDGGSSWRIKQGLAGFVEIYTSDTNHNFETYWTIDASLGADRVRESEIIEPAVGEGSNLCKIPADFQFRRAALSFVSKLQSNTSQIKIKNIILMQETRIEEIEQVR